MPRWRQIAPLALIVLATLLTYGRVVGHRFTFWDDRQTIIDNPAFNPVTVPGVLSHWQRSAGDLYIPVTYSAWGLLAAVSGQRPPDADGATLAPAVFHAASLALHAANALLVYLLLLRLVGRRSAAVVGALLFAVHPMQVETVAWASGLKDLLAAACVLAFLLCYLRAVESPSPWRRPAYYAAAGLVVLGMLCKPSAMVGPALAGLVEWQLLRRPVRQALRHSLPMLVPLVPLAAIAWLVQQAPLVQSSPPWWRPLVAADALAFYLWKWFLPLDLAPIYGRTPEVVVLERGWALWTWVVPAGAALACVAWRRRWPELGAAGLVLVTALLPLLGLQRFDFQFHSTVADHYLYLPMLAPAWLASVALARRRSLALGLAALVLVAWSVRSFVQLGHWRDDLALWQHTVQVAPGSHGAHLNLANALRRLDPPDLAGAAEHYREALALRPGYLTARLALASCLQELGRSDEAISELQETLRRQERSATSLTANRVRAHAMLGDALLETGRPAEAASHFEKALELDAGSREARAGLERARAGGAPRAPP